MVELNETEKKALETIERAKVIVAILTSKMAKEPDAEKRQAINAKLNAMTLKVAEILDALEA